MFTQVIPSRAYGLAGPRWVTIQRVFSFFGKARDAWIEIA